MPVCPFLALVSDRDSRADLPDRRHRCYAEPEPAPRAIAHQQQYCLTPAFATCATFQDWARREAARVVPSGAGPAAGGTQAADSPPVWERPADLEAAEAPLDREQPAGARPAVPGDVGEPGLWSDERAWAAPPPWRRGEDAEAEPQSGTDGLPGSAAGDSGGLARGAGSGEPGSGEPGVDRGQAGSAWGEAALRGAQLGPLPEPPDGVVPSTVRRPFDERWAPGGGGGPAPDASRRAGTPWTAGDRWDPRDDASPELPAFLARRAAVAPDSHRDAAAPRPSAVGPVPRREPGAGSSAGVRPSPDLRPDGTPRPGRAVRPAPQARSEAPARSTTAPAVSEPGAGRLGLRGMPALRRPRAGAVTGPEALGAPSWETPLRREAYPDLRTRVGLPQIPRLWLGAIALVVAGVILFLAPTLVPGFFGGQPAATPVPTPAATPTVSVAPTPPPLPTPFVYTVVQGDTLSGIAARNGLTLAQLLKANPQIKNENQLAIGDKLTIPVKTSSGGAVSGTGGAAASGAP
jgi:hypothetical protein